MLDLNTIGYFLYMEKQENRSREQGAAQETAEPPQKENGRESFVSPERYGPYSLYRTKADN